MVVVQRSTIKMNVLRLLMRSHKYYGEINNYLHTIVAQTFSLRPLLHKLKVCATAQSSLSIWVSRSKSVHIFLYFAISY